MLRSALASGSEAVLGRAALMASQRITEARDVDERELVKAVRRELEAVQRRRLE